MQMKPMPWRTEKYTMCFTILMNPYTRRSGVLIACPIVCFPLTQTNINASLNPYRKK